MNHKLEITLWTMIAIIIYLAICAAIGGAIGVIVVMTQYMMGMV